MSQMNPFMPLHQALFHPHMGGGDAGMAAPMVPSDAIQSGMFNPAMQLQTAQNMGIARQKGQTATSQNYFTNGPSPIQRSVIAAKSAIMGASADLDDESRQQLEHLRDDPNTSLQDFEGVLKSVRAGRPHGKQLPQQQGQTPVSNTGSMTVTRGNGPNAMSPDAMRQWSQRVAMDHMPHDAGDVGGGPGGGGGFQIAGMPTGAQPPQQQQNNPAMQMLAAFKGHVPDELLNAASQGLAAGIPPQQIYSHLQTAMQQQSSGQQRQTAANEREQHSMKMKQYGQLHSEMLKMQHDAYGVNLDQEVNDQDDEQTRALKTQYMNKARQFATIEHEMQGGGGDPQQQNAGPISQFPADVQMSAQQQQPSQITDPSQVAGLPSGSQFVFNGHVYRKH